jgi:glutaredoxin 3
MTAHVVLYHTASCPYCVRAERLLEAKGVTDIERIRVDLDPEQRAIMMQRTGRRTVPQIYVGDTHVGGFDDLYALDQAGRLDPLLKGEAPKRLKSQGFELARREPGNVGHVGNAIATELVLIQLPTP